MESPSPQSAPPFRLERIQLADPEVVRIIRTKSFAERVAMTCEMHETARALLRGRLATDHPEWSGAQIEAAIARRLLGDAE